MNEISDEDRRRIYLEEKARLEAQTQLRAEMAAAEVRERAELAALPRAHPTYPWLQAPPADIPDYQHHVDAYADPRIEAEVAGHLSFAKWMILIGFFILPIIFIPIAIYHGTQANAKGRGGQGNATIATAIVAFIVDIALWALIAFISHQ